MKIGLPKALLYYRYGQLWETFFKELGCEVILSGDTRQEILSAGVKHAVDENCLPLKLFLGHVQSLIGRCDYIFVPRFSKRGREDEYCVRFWGLPDLVRNTFQVPVLTGNLDAGGRGAQAAAFVNLGRALGKGPAASLRAYRAGCSAQQHLDRRQRASQDEGFASPGVKVLLAAQPYLIHDPYVGRLIKRLVTEQGGTPLFSDRCDRVTCRALSKELSNGLYWTLNKEVIGAVRLHERDVDGIILLTAFPCGSDSLVNELVLRRVKGVPLIQILLDEHTAPAGLETRIESFMDILQRRPYAR